VQDAATAAGVGAGDFNIALATNGNGLVVSDNTAGAEAFNVTFLNESQASVDLGIFKNAGADSEIAGKDVAMVRADSVFTHLINLRAALVNDSDSGITLAAERIESDIDTLARVRADVGVRAQQIESQQTRSSELKILERSMLSELQDADLTEVITRFTQLQQQLQASLSVGAQRLQLSLLDFLR
jgi:flagellin-like hook-associated protein FlgL